MEIETVNEEGNELEIRIVGVTHTYANLLRGFLQNDEHVTFAAYKVPHPLLDSKRPFLRVSTDGKKTPRQALIDANNSILAIIEEIKKEL